MNNKQTKKNIENSINKTSNSLMKKTKAQLVEIILRKDELECNLRSDIKGTEKELNNLREKYCNIKEKYITLKNDYQEECDENSSIRQELCDKVTLYKTMFYIVLTISVGLIASIIKSYYL